MPKDKPKHTPTPWNFERLYSNGRLDRVAIHPSHFYSESAFVETDMANAEHIVKCVNSHDALVKAFHRLRKDIDTALLYKRMQKGTAEDMNDTIDKALKQAGE